VQKIPETGTSLEDLHYLPAFAQYLLTHRLDELSRLQIQISREIHIPLLKRFEGLTEEKILEINTRGLKETLICLAQNKAKLQIETAVQKWKKNRLPLVQKDEIVAEDITLITYIRKKSFLFFLPDYSSETEEIIEIIKELDLFLMEGETIATNLYIELLKQRIDEHSHFIEKITNTSPGIIYVYDVVNNKELYANQASTEYLGFRLEDITEMGDKFVETLIHPDDLAALKQYEQEFKTTKDGEIRSFKYRIRNSKGEYRWLRTYETVFKRNEQGELIEKIGIAIDVHEQKITADQLKERESELLEAQEIAQLGSFKWDFLENKSEGSPQTKKILEDDLTDYKAFLNKVHPDDKRKVEQAIEEALKTGVYECEYRYLGHENEKLIWSRGIVSFKDGKPVCLYGTVMDTTERHKLLQRLQENESLHKQAEALTHIGNYKWDLLTNEVKWSDELYRIHGLEPQSKSLTFDLVESLTLPEEREFVHNEIQKALKSKEAFDFYFRIPSKHGEPKILHARGSIKTDDSGKPVSVIGTVQDVTEKQTLFSQLSHSEKIYQQAEALANMGNWSMDMKTKKLKWSYQLYKIYGLDSESEEMTTEKYLSFVHPDDKKMVEESLATLMEEKKCDYTFRIITRDGQLKILRCIAYIETDEKGVPVLAIGTEDDVTERENLIASLEERDRLYKQAQALVHMGNWSMDLQTRKLTWSDEMYNIYELPRDADISNQHWANFIHPDEKEDVLNYLDTCIRNKHPYDKTHRIVLPDGKIKTLHRKAELITDKEGNVIKMVGTTQDVTEQQRIQQELKDNQTFIQKITDAAPSIIASYNVNTNKYVFISGGLKKLLGYSTKDVMDQGTAFFVSLIHPDDLEELQQKNAEALREANAHPEKNDFIIEFTYRIRHANNHYRWFHTYGTIFDRNIEGKVEHVLNISIDVTEQKEATQRIKEQEHFIQQIADASPTILYLFDAERQSIVYINREIFFVLGYLPDEIQEAGEEVTSLLYHPDEYHLLPERRQSDRRFQQVDSMVQYECRLKSRDGDWRWFLIREIVFKTDEHGHIKQILGAALDIHKRKEMERTILQNATQLEQSNASLEEFAYVASHDLKEPLRKISTFGDRLVATHADTLSPEGKIYLKKIVDASQRMQIMISDLLSISMISGNRQFEKYSLQKILEETLQTLEFKIEQKNALIKSDPLPEAYIIPSQFRQLFQNLLSNSLKFAKEDVQPVITISYSIVTEKEMTHYQVAEAKYYHKLEISDNGIGFENEFAGKIFAIFQRLHGRSEYEGSGIGLAICKKIVEHHGGIIYASGVPEVGATFTIILPA
jgi:PAS domain S-box-containing protein